MLFILRFRKIYSQILTFITGHDEHEFEQNLRDSKGQGSLAYCSPWGRKESDTTEPLNNNRSSEPCKLGPQTLHEAGFKEKSYLKVSQL